METEKQLKQLEVLLMVTGGPISKRQIASTLGCDITRVEELLEQFIARQTNDIVSLIDDGVTVALAVNPSLVDFVKKARKDETLTPLSRASQETLSIISYAGPIIKTDIDFLRGVNNQYTLRQLTIRGLVREVKADHRREYVVTVACLHHMGVQKQQDLPEYEKVRSAIIEGIKDMRSMEGG